MNNAQLGMTIQSLICKKFNLDLTDYAEGQFESNFNYDYVRTLEPLIDNIFLDIGSVPTECTTFKKSDNKKETWLPYNFILADNSTLSIRTNKTGDKISPRVVGQSGYLRLNQHFQLIFGRKILNQKDIKELVFSHIHEILPTFIEYLLYADYTVWIYYDNSKFHYNIMHNDYSLNIDFKRENFTFTRTIDEWNESVTLKYKGVSIAEIQVHKNRTFKFRFIMKNFFKLLEESIITNETFGITAEKTICDLYDLTYPESYLKRSSKHIQISITPVIEEAFRFLPKPIMHTGSTPGERSSFSKCPYDFILTGNKTLSVKTNIGKFVCPPEVGQPSDSTFYHYFNHLIDEEYVDEKIFKNLVLSKVNLLIPIYLDHLFDSDFLLRINKDDIYNFDIIEKGFGYNFNWKKENFSFTNPTVEQWNESNTVKYNNITLGNFQVHSNRNCYKFRFHFENLLKIIKS